MAITRSLNWPFQQPFSAPTLVWGQHTPAATACCCVDLEQRIVLALVKDCEKIFKEQYVTEAMWVLQALTSV